MENKFLLQQNGQEVQQADFNVLGDSSGLADDRVLAELVRLAAYDGSNVTRGIMPYGAVAPGAPGQGGLNVATAPFAPVTSGGANGSVNIYPFRAFVGSRTAIGATSQTPNWRDIRSTVFTTNSATNLYQTFAIAANAAGNPRWTLVYAQISPDANGPAISRFVKDPVTGAEGAQSIVTTLVTKVVIGNVDGAAGASPTFPAAPADAGGNYYIPLAYIRVPNGFVAGSTVGVNDIYEVAPIIQLSPTTGTTRCSPANGINTTGGELQTRIPWPASGNRPGPYMPPSMTGMESRFFGLQLGTGLTASIANGDTIDQSIDWRNRFFWCWAVAVGGASSLLAQDPAATSGTNVPSAGTPIYVSMGQTFQTDPAAISGVAKLLIVRVTPTQLAGLGAASQIDVWVDPSTGAMRVNLNGTANAQVFFRIDATASFSNK
jgi:hypothetical protein